MGRPSYFSLTVSATKTLQIKMHTKAPVQTIGNPLSANKEEEPRCHPSPSGSSERSAAGRRVGRAAGAAAVASDAAPGPHHRRPRTEPSAHCPPRTCSKIEPQPTQAVGQGGPDTVLCTSDPYWTSVTTDRYLTASCKTPSDVDAGLPSCTLGDQFSTCSTGIFDYCRDLFFLTIAQATY